jgi:hypothetical protein
MKPHVRILHQLYGELVGKPWELSGAVVYPRRSYFFSPTSLDGLWVDIRFDTHCPESNYLESAVLRLYDPAEVTDGSVSDMMYLELQEFDSSRFSQSGFIRATGQGNDAVKIAWCELVVQDVIKLKRQATYAQIISLIQLRSFCQWAEEQSLSCVSGV